MYNMSLSTLVPTNYVLTSGVNSVMSWSNVLTLSTANCSTVNTSSIVTNSIGANVVTLNSTLSVSTLTARTVNYSSITGSSISSNAMTLSLTNVSTQNTQIYQVATSNPTTSYTAIQASHVSTGTTNNALVLNPSGGNVGVGTTAPGAKVHAMGSVYVHNNTINSAGGFMKSYLIPGVVGGLSLGALSGGVGGAELPAIYCNDSGYVGIGTTTPTFPLTFIGSAACFGWNTTGTTFSDPLFAAVEGISLRTTGGGYGIFSASTTIPLYLGKYGTGIIASFRQSAALGTTCGEVGNISVTASATTYNSGSDRRLKENIQDVADIRGMINHLRPRTFQFIRDDQKETYIGFIAQEVRENYPQYISGQETETEYLSMDYGKFSPFAISACKDLYNENDALKARIAALEAEVAAKSASLDALSAWAQTQGYSASS